MTSVARAKLSASIENPNEVSVGATRGVIGATVTGIEAGVQPMIRTRTKKLRNLSICPILGASTQCVPVQQCGDPVICGRR